MIMEFSPLIPDADSALAAAIREVEKRIAAGEKIDWTARAKAWRADPDATGRTLGRCETQPMCGTQKIFWQICTGRNVSAGRS